VVKKRRNTTYSAAIAIIHGSAINPANRRKLTPLALNANRFVRFDTGSSSEPVLDKWVQAYTCGRARTPRRAAVANTTGVNNTTVASRPNTAVTSEATTNTATNSRSGRPLAARAIHAPHQTNRPSSAHNWANTSTAAKNPTTGASFASSARASASEIAPMPTTISAAGAATRASGQLNGRITAHASTATNKTTGAHLRYRYAQKTASRPV
jgi:hypothetical protein